MASKNIYSERRFRAEIMKLLPILIAAALGKKKGSRTENAGIAKLEKTINALDNEENDLFKDARFKKPGFKK